MPRSTHPLIYGAAFAAVLAALGTLAEPPKPAAPASASGPTFVTFCGPGEVPDGPSCVPVTASDEKPPSKAPLDPVVVSDHIPRRPDRPADYAVFAMPLGDAEHPPVLHKRTSLDAEADGVYVESAANAGIVALSAEGQTGPSEVIAVGEVIRGPITTGRPVLTIITKNAVKDAEKERVFLFVYGNVERVAAGVSVGSRLATGAALGTAGPSGDGLGSEIYFETRLLREGVGLEGLDPQRIRDPAISVAVDVRNVLAPSAKAP